MITVKNLLTELSQIYPRQADQMPNLIESFGEEWDGTEKDLDAADYIRLSVARYCYISN